MFFLSCFSRNFHGIRSKSQKYFDLVVIQLLVLLRLYLKWKAMHARLQPLAIIRWSINGRYQLLPQSITTMAVETSSRASGKCREHQLWWYTRTISSRCCFVSHPPSAGHFLASQTRLITRTTMAFWPQWLLFNLWNFPARLAWTSMHNPDDLIRSFWHCGWPADNKSFTPHRQQWCWISL